MSNARISTWHAPILVAAAVTAATLVYWANFEVSSGTSAKDWFAVGAIVFIPWLSFALLVYYVRRLKHMGAARLFQVIGFASAVFGAAATIRPAHLPSYAAAFAIYGAIALFLCAVIWWVVEGFVKQRSK